ncbi:MAG: Bacterial sugar transferase, partial [Thermoleophilaceae bacterium]|nr:Bacterial sugar transferase [Thermoleophilaceae bacterium]
MITRALDVLVASVALAVSSPVMLVATVAIRLETPGSPIYRQRRIGRDGEA